MKKVYTTPLMEVINIDAVGLMSTSNPVPPTIGIDKEGAAGGEQLSNDRRGSWGNLWNE